MLFSAPSLALLLAFMTDFNDVSEAANLRQRSLQTYTPSDDYFSLMLDRVNQERATEGPTALCMNKKLQAAAQRHSDDQAINNYMDHTGTDGSTIVGRITEAGFDWSAVAENVAAGQVDVDAVMESWVNSPGHRENVLGDYTMFGTAYAYNAESTFQHYWTRDFGTDDDEECDSAVNDNESEETMTALTESKALDADPNLEHTEVSSTATDELTMQTLNDPIAVLDPPEIETSDPETDAPTTTETPVIIVDPPGVGTPCPDTPETKVPVVVVDPPAIGTPCPETKMPTAEEAIVTVDSPEIATPCPETSTNTPVAVVDPPEIGTTEPETTYDATKTHLPEKKDCKSSL